MQLIPILLYLPWLPIAWRQITTWPSEKQSASFSMILETISTTLLFGLSWPFNQGLTPAIGLVLMLLITLFPASVRSLPRGRFPLPASRFPLLWLWFLLPLALTVFIFSPAFLKFLLVATPPLALLLALTIESIGCRVVRFRAKPPLGTDHALRTTHHAPQRAMLGYLASGALLIALTAASALSLSYYYTDAAYARDNYRSIANFIKAVSGPDDAVILSAEGQQDVFNYYYYNGSAVPAAPVYPLPRRRPLDEVETLAELQAIADNASKIYAVYWATQQADPNGLIESWLDTHLFKAADQWYGNVRLVSYASPHASAKLPLTPVDYQFGPHIRLIGSAQSTPPDHAGRYLAGGSLVGNGYAARPQ